MKMRLKGFRDRLLKMHGKKELWKESFKEQKRKQDKLIKSLNKLNK